MYFVLLFMVFIELQHFNKVSDRSQWYFVF
jgi:hypothetical protein